MKMTITKLANILNVSRETIEQVGSKQLFVAHHIGYKLYFSYDTCIAIKVSDRAIITDTFYSVTTSKHKSIVKKLYDKFEIVDDATFTDWYDCVWNSTIV